MGLLIRWTCYDESTWSYWRNFYNSGEEINWQLYQDNSEFLVNNLDFTLKLFYWNQLTEKFKFNIN